MDMENYMWIVWLSIMVVAIIVEALTDEIVSVWFAGGALLAFGLSFVPGLPWWGELIAFAGLSIILMACLRPLVKKFVSRNIVSSNIDSIIHKKGEMLEKADMLHEGLVLVGDVKWTAICPEEEDSIEKGAIVEILAVKGNKLVVREYKPKEGEK